MNTTGCTRVGDRSCDAHTEPPGRGGRLHTETPVRLPHGQWCYRPSLSVVPAAEPPMKQNGFVTFASFNQVSKLSPSAHSLWGEILMRLPRSRLMVASVPEGYAKESLLANLGGAGVAASRIAFVPHVAPEEYFRRFDAADIALDSTPYSGCSTTFDTLWMGVPVITLARTTSVSRITASVLSELGLADGIVSPPGVGVRLVVQFVAAPSRCSDLTT